jgi:hypothetical protein
MEDELFRAFSKQVKLDKTNKNTFLVELVELLLMSPVGEKLKAEAMKRREPLLERLREYLKMLMTEQTGEGLTQSAKENSPTRLEESKTYPALLKDSELIAEISQLASESERYPEQMMIYLVRIGLKRYKEVLKEQSELL